MLDTINESEERLMKNMNPLQNSIVQIGNAVNQNSKDHTMEEKVMIRMLNLMSAYLPQVTYCILLFLLFVL